MKTKNLRMQALNGALNMLSRFDLTKRQASAENKKLRQEKRALKRSSWHFPGCGARECARRRWQIAYGRGLVDRRALPSKWQDLPDPLAERA